MKGWFRRWWVCWKYKGIIESRSLVKTAVLHLVGWHFITAASLAPVFSFSSSFPPFLHYLSKIRFPLPQSEVSKKAPRRVRMTERRPGEVHWQLCGDSGSWPLTVWPPAGIWPPPSLSLLTCKARSCWLLSCHEDDMSWCSAQCLALCAKYPIDCYQQDTCPSHVCASLLLGQISLCLWSPCSSYTNRGLGGNTSEAPESNKSSWIAATRIKRTHPSSCVEG